MIFKNAMYLITGIILGTIIAIITVPLMIIIFTGRTIYIGVKKSVIHTN